MLLIALHDGVEFSDELSSLVAGIGVHDPMRPHHTDTCRVLLSQLSGSEGSDRPHIFGRPAFTSRARPPILHVFVLFRHGM